MTDDDKSGKTFTQAEVDALIRDRLARERSKYSDYDELKAAAADADKSKSALDKLTDQIAALTKRAEASDLEIARRDVADEFGLTRREARRLSGKNADELRADAKDMVDDLGIDVAKRKAGKGKEAPAGKSGGEDGNDEGDGTDGNDGDGAGDNDEGDTSQQQAPARRTRPRENLRSGAPVRREAPEETDPLKLIAGVPRF